MKKEEFCDFKTLKLILKTKKSFKIDNFTLISSTFIAMLCLNLIFAMSIVFCSVFMHHKVIELVKIHLRSTNYLMHVDEASSRAGNCFKETWIWLSSNKKVTWDVFIGIYDWWLLELFIGGAFYRFWGRFILISSKFHQILIISIKNHDFNPHFINY